MMLRHSVMREQRIVVTALVAERDALRSRRTPMGFRSTADTALDRGFAGLYNLDFAGAQKDFPVVGERCILTIPSARSAKRRDVFFAEFNRLGVLGVAVLRE